jgi:hypothetical protein
MEKVYKEIKLEFEGQLSPELMRRFKPALLRATEGLSAHMPPVALVTEQRPLLKSNNRPVGEPAANESISSLIMKVSRPALLRINGAPIPAKIRVDIAIPRIIMYEEKSKITIGKSTYAMYQIASLAGYQSDHSRLSERFSTGNFKSTKEAISHLRLYERRYRYFISFHEIIAKK